MLPSVFTKVVVNQGKRMRFLKKRRIIHPLLKKRKNVSLIKLTSLSPYCKIVFTNSVYFDNTILQTKHKKAQST
jgi:hypothetical protein